MFGNDDQLMKRVSGGRRADAHFLPMELPGHAGDKTGDAKQERVFEQVFRQILRWVSVFIVLPLHSRKVATRLLVVNAIAETASVSIAID
jgi:hypothetical protein